MPNAGKPMDSDVPGPPKTETGSDDSTSVPPVIAESEIDGSMHTEEPTGWDQAPQAIKDPRQKRHPRPDGIGGLEPSKDPNRAADNI